ncbi:Flp pilus assembly protein CpaB [Enemella dayhoffiae]|uniref:Flp pilus assembly protein CpaB n=1 Tax=Enemella dayhoffiae TaxID=2016507 RepID=A0A255H9K5_9ACTN|nr:SAF domain-containing protein [Enemella dayhoffiae]OYO24520.1 Flp pilus assembly protein CpaB [Enemella dayhoffiae]
MTTSPDLPSAPPPAPSRLRQRRSSPRRRSPLGSLGRWLTWHRRTVAVLCAIGAVLCTLAAARAEPEPGVPVLVAARALPGGQPLTESDLRVAHFPTRIAPGDRLERADAVLGRVLTAPITAGTPVTELSVVAPRPRTAGDRVLAPVRLTDPGVAALLRVGDPIDVLATPMDGAARVVARGARVAALPTGQSGGGSFGASEDSRGALLLLEADPAAAPQLAQNSGRLSILIR